MRVMVTGASGFIGRHVVEALSRRPGVEVVAVSRSGQDQRLKDVRTETCDLLGAGAPAKLIARVRPERLIHLAWEARPGVFWNAPENLDWCAASLALLRAFADAGGRRAVLAGSCAEYSWRGPLLSEDVTPTEPATLYGVTKNALGEVARAWAEQAGLSLAWGRVFWLYGPGEPAGRLASDVMSALMSGRPAMVSEGVQERDFLHVADVAGAFVAALFSDYLGVFNIGSGQPVAVREVVQALASLIGREDLLRWSARPTLPEPARLSATTQVLTERIGFVPRYSLAQGLAQAVDERRKAIA